MVKITCPPYFLQLDLYGDVDEQRSKATIEPGVVMVKIPKQQPGTWPQLKAAGPAEEIKARREAAIEIKRARDEKAVSDTKEKKRQDDDYVFHKQWDLEKDEKRTIERLAELHKREAEASLQLGPMPWRVAAMMTPKESTSFLSPRSRSMPNKLRLILTSSSWKASLTPFSQRPMG